MSTKNSKNSKRILSSGFKIFKPTKKSLITYPAFLFDNIKQIDIDKLKVVVFSPKRKVLFFVYNDEDFIVIPLDTPALNFFKRKNISNIVIYNCSIDEIEDREGKVLSLFYEN